MLVLLPGLEACGNLDQFSTAISARKGLGVEVTGRYRDDTWAARGLVRHSVVLPNSSSSWRWTVRWQLQQKHLPPVFFTRLWEERATNKSLG